MKLALLEQAAKYLVRQMHSGMAADVRRGAIHKIEDLEAAREGLYESVAKLEAEVERLKEHCPACENPFSARYDLRDGSVCGACFYQHLAQDAAGAATAALRTRQRK